MIDNSTIDILKAEAARQPYPLLFVTVSGAHLYGFPSPDSDYDLRGVHVLPAIEMLDMYEQEETIEVSRVEHGIDFDIVTHDAKKFFSLMLRRNGYVLEQLYSPIIIDTTPEHDELKLIARDCITRHHVHHYKGFAKTQWELFINEQPRRVKPLLYVFRVLLTGIHLMRAGEIEANILTLNDSMKLPYIDELIHRKTAGEQTTIDSVDIEFYRSEYVRLTEVMETAGQKSTLAETPTAKGALSDLLVRLRLKTMNQ